MKIVSRFTYKTSCLDSTGRLIKGLQESAIPVTFDEFAQNVIGLEKWSHEFGYIGVEEDTFSDGRQGRGGLTLRDDVMVTYFKGVYDGQRAYFLVHSRIEHVWTNKEIPPSPNDLKPPPV